MRTKISPLKLYAWKLQFLFAYRAPSNSNKDSFFKELIKSLSNITRKYENVLAAVDLIIDFLHEKRFEKLLI